jgi:hypothetical protein
MTTNFRENANEERQLIHSIDFDYKRIGNHQNRENQLICQPQYGEFQSNCILNFVFLLSKLIQLKIQILNKSNHLLPFVY